MGELFDDLVQGLTEAIEFARGTGKAVVSLRTVNDDNKTYKSFYEQLTDEEKDILSGKMPVTKEQADKLIEKIENHRKWLNLCDLDRIVAEKADGMYVISSPENFNFRLLDVARKVQELGRPLTDEEFEEFIIHDDEL